MGLTTLGQYVHHDTGTARQNTTIFTLQIPGLQQDHSLMYVRLLCYNISYNALATMSVLGDLCIIVFGSMWESSSSAGSGFHSQLRTWIQSDLESVAEYEVNY